MVVVAYRYVDPVLDGSLLKGGSLEHGALGHGALGHGANSTSENNSGCCDFDEESVDRVYQDLGDRTQFNQFIAFATTLVDAASAETCESIRLIIRRLEELGDSIAEVSDRLHQLETLGVDLTILNAPESNLSLIPDRDSRVPVDQPPIADAALLHQVQSLQNTQRQRNMQRGHAKNRLKLKPPPGKAPYGYRRGKDRYILDRTTAPVVKDFFEHFLLYGSLRRSVRYLAQKYNKKISVSTGKRWLSHPVYRGHLAYKTGDVIMNTHTPVVTEGEAAQVDRLLRRNRQLPRRSASAERSLAGLVRCSQCQSPMTVTRVTQRRKKREYLYLRPTQCSLGEGNGKSCSAISYDRVLDQTIDQICQTLPHIMATAQLPDVGAFKQGIDAQIQAKQAIIDQLPALGHSGVLDQATIELRTYNLRTEIAALQSSLAQLPPVNLQETVQTVSLRQFWLDLSESERRFYFREFIHHIEIVRSPSDLAQWHTKLVLLLEMSR